MLTLCKIHRKTGFHLASILSHTWNTIIYGLSCPLHYTKSRNFTFIHWVQILWRRIVSFPKTLRKKYANVEFFLVRIFPYSVQIRKNTDQKKLHIWTIFAQWEFRTIRSFFCGNCVFPQNFYIKRLDERKVLLCNSI